MLWGSGRRLFALLGTVLTVFSASLLAHPMPNSEITVSLGAATAAFEIAVPGPELRLALPPTWDRAGGEYEELRVRIVVPATQSHGPGKPPQSDWEPDGCAPAGLPPTRPWRSA